MLSEYYRSRKYQCVLFKVVNEPAGLLLSLFLDTRRKSFTRSALTAWSESRPRRCGCSCSEEALRHLPWWRTQPSSDRSHANALQCSPAAPTGGPGPSWSSEPAELPAPSRCSWYSQPASPAGKAAHLWRCCCTSSRWSREQSWKWTCRGDMWSHQHHMRLPQLDFPWCWLTDKFREVFFTANFSSYIKAEIHISIVSFWVQATGHKTWRVLK